MLFNSLAYLIFLPVVVALFWLTPFKWRTALLLVASYVFYMFWKPIYGLLMLGLTAFNYFVGLAMERSQTRKKAWLVGGIVTNVAMLAFFKYTYFMRDMANDLARFMHMGQVPPVAFEIILPLGISFFVFEFIHYLSEVYKGSPAVKGPLDFALFAAFFPTQIAGPIKRYQDFIPQLKVPQKVTLSEFNDGIELIMFGLFKKVVFADTIAIFTNRSYAHTELLTGMDLWLAIWAFAFQIYFDFSGYTDIARGSAKLIGFKVPINFDLPFLSASWNEYWRRWHISLSTWLRDYLYFPLGGSKHGEFATCRNLVITMTLGGLWHGAAPHFVMWGFWVGVLLVVHRMWRKVVEASDILLKLTATKLFHYFAIFLTFQAFCVTLTVFRCPDCPTGYAALGRMFGLLPQPDGTLFWQPTLLSSSGSFIYPLIPLVLVAMLAGQLLSNRFRSIPGYVPGTMPLPGWLPAAKPVYLACLIALLLMLSPDITPQFIYFQF